MRNLTPRYLNMSVTIYEEQDENSRAKLRVTLCERFDVENNVTQVSLDKMIKTWMRKDRERMKRNSAGTTKVSSRYNATELDALKKHRNDPRTKEKSKRMEETRKKVVNHSRVGQCGYAGKAEKLVCHFHLTHFNESCFYCY